MSSICIVDFDETLLKVDSTRYIIRSEKLYFQPRIFAWGIVFIFAKFFLPKKLQLPIRYRAKYAILWELKKRGEARMLEKYSKIFAQFLNFELVKKIQNSYQKVYVISAAWEPLIRATLEQAGISGWTVHGTKFTEDFSKFKTCWNINKVKIVKELGIANFDLYTDSQDDRPLMELAEKTYMV